MTASGDTIWAQVDGTLLQAGEQWRLLEQIQDISERHRHEERLAHLAGRPVRRHGVRRPRIASRLRWQARIRDALANDGLRLMSQPIADPRTGAVVAHELLVRMLGDEGELITPDTFLYIAEHFDLIQAIDQWVLGQACDLLDAAQVLHRPGQLRLAGGERNRSRPGVPPESPGAHPRGVAPTGVNTNTGISRPPDICSYWP